MNITLTRKEFTRLIELAYIGDWVATSMDEGDDMQHNPYVKRYGDLMQKLYRLAATEDDGCPQYVEPATEAEDEGKFFPAFRLENDSPATRAIDKFANDTFWEELITRMAERDVFRETERDIATGTPPILTPDEMHEQTDQRLSQLEDRYREEFVRNDLENVIVLFGADRLS